MHESRRSWLALYKIKKTRRVLTPIYKKYYQPICELNIDNLSYPFMFNIVSEFEFFVTSSLFNVDFDAVFCSHHDFRVFLVDVTFYQFQFESESICFKITTYIKGFTFTSKKKKPSVNFLFFIFCLLISYLFTKDPIITFSSFSAKFWPMQFLKRYSFTFKK